jgi:hypothetical protein
MSNLTVTGNAPLTPPLAVSSQFARSTTTDVAALTAIANALTVPSFVSAPGGTIGAPSGGVTLTDDQKEQCVRDWVWRNCYFTGTTQATTPALANVYRSLEIYQWREGGIGPSGTNYTGNAALNSGKGPTMACAQISYLYLGLLASLGIAGRAVNGTSGTQGSDVEAEYWSPAYAKWVMTLPSMNAHKTFTATGIPVSTLEHVLAERSNGLTATAPGSGIFTGVGLDGSNGRDFTGVNFEGPYWATFSQNMAWERGNYYHLGNFSGSSAVFIPPRMSGQQWVTAQSLADIDFTVNALHLTIEQRASGMAVAFLEHNMLELAALQVLAPGGAWANIPEAVAGGTQNEEAVFGFAPVSGQTWQFRATGTLGNTSNIVTVACA